MKKIIDLYSKEELDEIREYYMDENDGESIEEYFELTNRIFIGWEDDWDSTDQQFYFGPEVENECISDSLYLDGYLEKICYSLKYPVETQLMENVHGFYAETKNDFINQINQIISYVEQDGYEVYKFNE